MCQKRKIEARRCQSAVTKWDKTGRWKIVNIIERQEQNRRVKVKEGTESEIREMKQMGDEIYICRLASLLFTLHSSCCILFLIHKQSLEGLRINPTILRYWYSQEIMPFIPRVVWNVCCADVPWHAYIYILRTLLSISNTTVLLSSLSVS